MKNKKLTYSLLLCVLLIWGTILFKIFANKKNNSDNIVSSTSMYHAKLQVDVDTFTILNSYPDPFLKLARNHRINPNEFASNKTPQADGARRETKTATILETRVNWPTVVYHGAITNNKTGVHLAMLNINKKPFQLSIGVETKDITALQIESDSIYLKFKTEKKWVKK